MAIETGSRRPNIGWIPASREHRAGANGKSGSGPRGPFFGLKPPLADGRPLARQLSFDMIGGNTKSRVQRPPGQEGEQR